MRVRVRVAVERTRLPCSWFPGAGRGATAVTLLRARALGIGNFSAFCNHVTIGPPLNAILDSPGLQLNGFIAPGHVSTVVGTRPYDFIVED